MNECGQLTLEMMFWIQSSETMNEVHAKFAQEQQLQ
jgi:hypothetical protein